MTTEKVTTSQEVDKGTKKLNDMKEAVVTIRGKDSDNFEGQSKVSIGWFNINHELKKESFLHLNRTFIISMKKILKVKIRNHIKRF